MGALKIIESVEDNYTFDRAWIAEENGELVPRALFGGVLVNIESKPTLLEAGIAFCEPIDGTAPDAWPVNVRVEHQEDGFQESLWNCTGNPRIVAAARKFARLMSSGEAREGMEL